MQLAALEIFLGQGGKDGGTSTPSIRRREWVRAVVVLAFPSSCLAEAERDNENFGAIFEHMYELYMLAFLKPRKQCF